MPMSSTSIMDDASDPSTSSISLSRNPSPINTKTNSPSQRPPSRHSPVAPLAPLEYLQNQRRGSITDPSLHAASTNHFNANHHAYRPSEPCTSLSLHESSHKGSISDPRPNSPYTFGDATAQPIRKLLRSPSSEDDSKHTTSVSPDSEICHRSPFRDASGLSGSTRIGGPGRFNEMEEMNANTGVKHNHQMLHIPSDKRDVPPFDYNMRRHSIAVGHDLHTIPSGSQLPLLHGTKRKMSSDRSIFAPLSEEMDPQLAGPGVPSVMNIDADAPAPKRRGSAIDTHRIAQLSLYDRRNSVDSRGNGLAQWWTNDSRESATSSIFSNTPSVGFGSGFSAESPHGRPPPSIAAFAWPTNNQPPEQAGDTALQNDTDTNMTNPPRQFDPNVSQLGMMSSIAYSPDRRLSMSDTITPSLSAGPTRVLRPRSRPPSRQLRTTDPPNPNSPGQLSNNHTNHDAPSPTSSTKPSTKDSPSTPYSRSPELRVSHKLAERKRRKEMKDLFDELREQLPADRGMKASKWEILSKTIDFLVQLKQSHQDMSREIEVLRHELDSIRQGGIPSFSAGPHAVVYGQGALIPGQYPSQPAPPQQHPPHSHPLKPSSSEHIYSPDNVPTSQTQNGNIARIEPPPS